MFHFMKPCDQNIPIENELQFTISHPVVNLPLQPSTDLWTTDQSILESAVQKPTPP